MGRAGAVGEAASQTPCLPRHELQAGYRRCRARPGPPDQYTVDSGPSQGTELPEGPGLPACPASVLLHRGARPAAAAAPEGRSGSRRAGDAELEASATFSCNFREDQFNFLILQ